MDEAKLEELGKTVNSESPNIERENTLIEGNEAAKWIQETLMKKMDKYAYARSLVLLCLFGFFLGNNLGIFLYLYLGVGAYLMIYRIVRFWVKRWLVYLTEFCYFGNALLICYITVYGHNQYVFYSTYVCSTGVIALSVIIFNNQAQFNSTDHLTSSYIHIFPLLCVWAIRWRDRIYSVDTWSNYFSFFKFNESEINADFYFNQIFPISYWLFWGVFYLIINFTLLSKYYNNPKFGSGIRDFLSIGASLKFFLGDLNKNTLYKYFLQHFLFFILTLPISWVCYNNFWCNTVYVLLIIIFLAWNSGRNNLRHLEKKLIKQEKKSKVEENYNV